MKTKVLLIILILTTSTVLSQNLKVKGGLCLSKIQASEEIQQSEAENRITFSPGISLGVSYSLHLFNSVYIEPNILFNQKGNRVVNTNESEEFINKVNHFHIDLPIYFNYKGEIKEKTFINLFAGPYLGFGVLANINIAGEKRTQEYGEENDNGETLNRVDYGLSCGLGLEREKIFLDVAYDLGIKNKIESPSDLKNRYRTIRLLVGYKF